MDASYVHHSCVHHSLKCGNNLGVYGWIDKENSFHSVFHYTFTQENYTYILYIHICIQVGYVHNLNMSPISHEYVCTHTGMHNGILFICKNHLAVWDSTDESGVYYVKLNKPSSEEEYCMLSFECANWKGQIHGNFWFLLSRKGLWDTIFRPLWVFVSSVL